MRKMTALEIVQTSQVGTETFYPAAEVERLVEAVEQANQWLRGGGDKAHVSRMLEAALAALKGE
jgi:hypothetical protein